MAHNFTDEQKLAVFTRDKDLLVSAAAGAGKTAVLVERIIHIITNDQKPVDIDRLLVVTYTEAAAAEMKERVLRAISERLELDQSNEHLKRQLMLLNNANISTVHSFCMKLIRNNFHLVDIDPNFRIADNTEKNLIKSEILDELFEEEYESNPDFARLAEAYGVSKVNDAQLQNLVLSVYEFIENSPWPQDSLDKCIEMFNGGVGTRVWTDVLKEDIRGVLDGALENVKLAIEIAASDFGPNTYVEALESDAELIAGLQLALDRPFDELYSAFDGVKFAALSRKKPVNEVDPDLKQLVQTIRNKDVKDGVASVQKHIFFKPPEKMYEDLQNVYPVMQSLGRLVTRFSEMYTRHKREKGLADFNDLEHYALDILMDGSSSVGNVVPSHTAVEYSRLFEEVLIDEYQDCNPIHELILSLISKKDKKNTFMVGDIKQSIYKFRRAKPELFIEKYKAFSNDVSGSSMKINLSKNFRSRENILDCVNFFFGQLMSRDATEIDYDDESALRVGAAFPDDGFDDTLEIYVIDRSGEGVGEVDVDEDTEIEELAQTELEARFVAEKINALVTESGGGICYGDIVILMRSVKNDGGAFVNELKRYNIPAAVDLASGFYDALEISTVISFLQVIDNPRQDVFLITVLHSPVYGLTADELMDVRGFDRKADFYMCVSGYAAADGCAATADKLNRFLSDLAKWRKLSAYCSISELISVIYRDTDYFNYAGALPGGDVRQANLLALKEKSLQYERTSFKGLFNFIKYMERVLKKEASLDEGEAKVFSENENIVRIMTIHKSKGLEFPVVFLCGLGKRFPKSDERKAIVMHEYLGFGPNYVDLDRRVKTNTLAKTAIVKKLSRESLAEDVRVLYVALTRAKSKLILTGCVKSLAAKTDKWVRAAGYAKKTLPAHRITEAQSMLDLVMAAALRHAAGEKVRRLSVNGMFIKTGNDELYNDKSRMEITLHSIADLQNASVAVGERNERLTEGLRDIINSGETDPEADFKLSWRYEREPLPSKLSVTEIKRVYNNESPDTVSLYETRLFNPPSFLKNETQTGIRRGKAIHAVLEHLELGKGKTSVGESEINENSAKKTAVNETTVNDLINRLVSDNIIERDDASLIPVKKIVAFAQSELGLRIAASERIYREIPFVLGLRPSEIYGDVQQREQQAESILVHGIIDCCFIEDGEAVIVDYKSDYVTEATAYTVAQKYRQQLLIYRKAVERSINKNVKMCVIYFVQIEKSIIID